MNAQPCRRILNPCANLRRDYQNRFRYDHPDMKRLKDACRSDQYEVMEWAGIGNDDHSG